MKWSGHQSQEKQWHSSSSPMELRTCSGCRREIQLTARAGQAQTSAITFQDQQSLCWHIHFLMFDSLLILAGSLSQGQSLPQTADAQSGQNNLLWLSRHYGDTRLSNSTLNT